MSRERHVLVSYFRPSTGPSITLLLAMPGVMWLFT